MTQVRDFHPQVLAVPKVAALVGVRTAFVDVLARHRLQPEIAVLRFSRFKPATFSRLSGSGRTVEGMICRPEVLPDA